MNTNKRRDTEPCRKQGNASTIQADKVGRVEQVGRDDTGKGLG